MENEVELGKIKAGVENVSGAKRQVKRRRGLGSPSLERM